MKLIFEKSAGGKTGCRLPACDVDAAPLDKFIPSGLLRKTPPLLPELSEPEVARHYTALSRLNFGVDSGAYPLGSCTMKYNPKINDALANLGGFANIHPEAGDDITQGCLALMSRLSKALCEITGMDAMSLQPAAGAHGELAGMMMIAAYHRSRGDLRRVKVLVPDTAHGTNPASAAMAGFETVEIKSNADGSIDIGDLRARLDSETAALMLTNPSTLGLFEPNITQIAGLVHEAGGLLYYDGANLNAIAGITRPGDMGFDVIHLNLHKTFSTPHGGGGPGSGPVGVKAALAKFLPLPLVVENNGYYTLCYDNPDSIGRLHAYNGNFGVLVRAYAYILSLGGGGLRAVAEHAVLNANYLMARLEGVLEIACDGPCMHEFVATARRQREAGVSALDIAKRMIDYGVHPPTVYFPLIVKEAMMFEPTETESKESLDELADIMIKILREAEENSDLLHKAPHKAPVGRLDDTLAARKPVLTWQGGT